MSKKMDTKFKQLDVLPIVEHYILELGLYELFDEFVPNDNNCEIAPAQVLCMMVMNIVVSAKPLYKIEEWLQEYLDGKSESNENSSKYNDDRIGRTLEYLFRADRKTLMALISIAAIKVHQLVTEIIHNDSTSVSFAGGYKNQSKDAVQIKFGFNKDHRPDYKQIVFGLNITEDGHVPISFDVFDGNQADVTTHIPNWDELRKFLETEDFIYVADTKLFSAENTHYIDKNGGRFITPMPKNLVEVKAFHERLRQGEEISWTTAYTHENSRNKNKIDTYKTYDQEKTKEGYVIIWVHSSSKEKRDYDTRARRIAKAEEELKLILSNLNKYTLKTRPQIEKKVSGACRKVQEFLTVEIVEKQNSEKVKIGRGRRGPKSKYKTEITITYDLLWSRDEEAIQQASKSDGIFPLATNDTSIPAREVLRTYKKQPFLEKRFYTKKSVLEVAPVFLKNNDRIEAMMFLYFIGLMIVSLVERNVRNQMLKHEINNLPILPTGMKTEAPTWNNICYFFRAVHLALITKSGKIIQSTVKGVTELHEQVLKLLKVPRNVYYRLRDNLWLFEFQ
jgi:transposase